MSDLLDRLNYYEGNLEDALVHATPLEGPLDIPGFPLGVTDDSAKSRVGTDFTLMRTLTSEISNKSMGVLGLQGFGKTFLLYVLFYMLSAEAAGKFTGSIQIDSLKHNNLEEPETNPLINGLLGCTVIQAAHTRLNPLSHLWDFTLDEQYEMMETFIEVQREKRLMDSEQKLLYDHLAEIYKTKKPTLRRLAALIKDYRAQVDVYNGAGHVTKRGYTKEQANELQRLAIGLSDAIENLTKGAFGKIFQENTDDEELIMLIEQSAKSWDFKGISPKVRSIIEVFRGTIETSALQLKDPDNPKLGIKHPKRVAQYIGRDEAYDAWGNERFANFEFTRMKTLRERDLMLMMCFHRLADFLSSVGSDKARNVIREIPIWFIGAQSTADLPDIRAHMDLPEHVIMSLPTLHRGQFWVIVPGRAPRQFTVFGTDLEIKAFATNQANHALLEQYFATGDLQYYMSWLEESSPDIDEELAAQEVQAAHAEMSLIDA